jgi:hypothetical protein
MRLGPRDFWALSLPEWRALCDARLPRAAAAMTRGDLDTLLSQHPDQTHG